MSKTTDIDEIVDSFSVHRPKGAAKGTLARRSLKKQLQTYIANEVTKGRLEELHTLYPRFTDIRLNGTNGLEDNPRARKLINDRIATLTNKSKAKETQL